MRDGNFYTKTILVGDQTFDLMDSIYDSEGEYDICEDCYRDFQRWFKRGRIKSKE